MARRRKLSADKTNSAHHHSTAENEPTELRIIGGSMRGRKLLYSGQLRTRPMKDRTREAVFNLLGPDVAGKHAIDLFAGTGALGLEAISRGAAKGTFIEQHFPTAGVIRQNVAALGVAERCEIHPANTFIWAQRQTLGGEEPWLIFCSPPFAFYLERQAEMLALIGSLLERSPPGSIFVVESDEHFDPQLLPEAAAWDIRVYSPAVVAIHRKASAR